MSSGSAIEEDIGDIRRKEIIILWDEGQDARRIAEQTGLTEEVVKRNLKSILRTLVRKRVDSHV